MGVPVQFFSFQLFFVQVFLSSLKFFQLRKPRVHPDFLSQVGGTVFLYSSTIGQVNEALGGEFMVAIASLTLVADYNPASKLQRIYYHMFHFPF